MTSKVPEVSPKRPLRRRLESLAAGLLAAVFLAIFEQLVVQYNDMGMELKIDESPRFGWSNFMLLIPFIALAFAGIRELMLRLFGGSWRAMSLLLMTAGLMIIGWHATGSTRWIVGIVLAGFIAFIGIGAQYAEGLEEKARKAGWLV
jgi:hypothetical protein